jgi:hypothetical protein
VNILGGGVTDCPRGHKATFLKGTYTIRDSILHLASSSPETLQAIKKIADAARTGKISAETARDQINELSPGLSSVLTGNSGNLLPYLALLAYMIVELGKATLLGPTQPAIVQNQINITKSIIGSVNSPSADHASGGCKIKCDDDHHSKRQKRRLKGAARRKMNPN